MNKTNKSDYKTEQEKFWSGRFGNEYIKRNQNYRTNIPFFSKIFSKTQGVETLIEFGANIGLNLIAVKEILPHIQVSGVEINQEAVMKLEELNFVHTYHESILDFKVDNQRDFVLIKGVLIHINPDYLSEVYEKLYDSSSKYICISEYYNPTPVTVEYRGHNEKLFKRDFAGEMLEKFPDLELIDYGFVYHRDPNFPQDDTTWFLLKKK